MNGLCIKQNQGLKTLRHIPTNLPFTPPPRVTSGALWCVQEASHVAGKKKLVNKNFIYRPPIKILKI